ncbi:AI-2E family transporter [Aliihoeflea aestuarii]|jgi:predicted PurR-regulated permease PerM|uniref:AI-2E family transporter n=1 Tax=Aliihoeflea aestuarii TaxID=453840 RepID=UPI002093507A|nr:AI-2E family transporter [Aliihoeflea aestuarii]MCO6391461.1 AI-2E family transporter [Aliihoeflea aestuarii]
MKTEHEPSGSAPPEQAVPSGDLRVIRRLMLGLFLLALVYALYFAREFFLPVVLAFLLALMLTPIVRFLKKHGVPEVLSATLLVFASMVGIGTAGYLLSGPVVELVNNAPQIGRQLSDRMEDLRRPFERFMEVSRQVDEVAETAGETDIQRVVVSQPGIVSRAAGNVLSAGTTAAITFVLSLFVLASGTMFYEKIVQSFTRMSEKKRALRVVYDVEREVSRYLLTISLINACLGAVIGAGLWVIGMPMPLVFGAAAGLLNFLPYIGAAMTIILVAIISVVTFDSLAFAMVAPLFVMICTVTEGNMITPLVVGRRLEINAVAIFIAVAFWSWLWGFVGALIAVPLLVIIKVFCDHFDSLSHVGNFLSAQQSVEEAEEDKQEAETVAP